MAHQKQKFSRSLHVGLYSFKLLILLSVLDVYQMVYQNHLKWNKVVLLVFYTYDIVLNITRNTTLVIKLYTGTSAKVLHTVYKRDVVVGFGLKYAMSKQL